uniref:Uncharacterized protein n=1 Tax=Meloidogyne enterolobii TaxID=390850 RepID=A0A6V7TW54_MELEN|nr:unnamed protein product [Meloidogyne enterolobii]
MQLFLPHFFTLIIFTFFFTLTKQQMHQRISQRKMSKEDFYLPKISKLNYREEVIKMLKQRKNINTCQFGKIRPLQIFVPKARALPIKQAIKNNFKNGLINDSSLAKNRKRQQQQRHYSNKKVFSQSPPNLKIKPLNAEKIEIPKLPTIDDKTGIEQEQQTQNNVKNLQQQKLRFFYTPSNTVVNQDFTFAQNTPGFACAYGLPTPIYNTPRKKCIPHSPLCGITFTCVMDVHAVDERGQRIENWWRGEEKVIEN